MNDSTNGNENGLNTYSAELARLAERTAAYQERLAGYEVRVTALEELLAERTKGTPIREWIGPIGTSLAGLFLFYQFGLEPIKDQIGREIADRKEAVTATVNDLKSDIRAVKQQAMDLLSEVQKRNDERNDARLRDVAYVDDRIDKVVRFLNIRGETEGSD